MKAVVGELARFGGTPEFRTPLRLGRPNIGDRARFFARLGGALDRGWLSNGGPLVAEFEDRVARITGARHCVATCNATLALQLAIRAAGWRGEVIVPALTFAATAHAVAWLGLTPVFCDVDPVTGGLDPGHAATLIGPRTSGILGVHLWGRGHRLDELTELAHRHGIGLLFDAAHAFACSWRGRPIGSFGAAEVFSFHSTKFVHAFEGGALVTDDDALAERARSLRNFGLTGPDEVAQVGVNAKMSEASAAMGLTSVDSLEEFRAHNAHNHARYTAGLAAAPGIRLLAFDPAEDNNFQYVVAEVDETVTGLGRDTLHEVLLAENVLARRYFHPGCHLMAPYRDGTRLPHTEALAARSLALPTGTAVGAEQIDRLCRLLRFAARNGRAIQDRIGAEPVIARAS
ncbi:aminotransferase class I/II-fold pyridoxal phosphate-dependent enzyme [Crossiella sp. SN42]|uniref:aminotransferase class I/II-fold pyridoxal phosphate-dependent enzyme n=1 Tax=Crossiella sp. SN42 TaxID=2944808 RepID=UPI00207C44EA|nr:aminotransferase class I/II-fold pyridoxal phosphate-dependent enzyme [Crossiella sp. SN42]MCO1580364.1 aminotransferase class I/II-fold pyridoxal phosphate-dependent enzyme [Crossiella sp. SN42]